MKNVWWASDTVRHESVQNINYCADSRIDYFMEIRQLQRNTVQIPIGPTLRPNPHFGKIKSSLKDFWLNHPKKVFRSCFIIGSVRNKLESLLEFLCKQVDFLAISQTKLDSYFPTVQFNLPGFRPPYMKDITARNGVLLVYVNGDIPSRVISIRDCTSHIQILLVEMNLKK